MSRSRNSSTPRPDANTRRDPSCAAEPRPGGWRRPYDRLRRSLAATAERLERSRVVVEAAEKVSTTLRVDRRQLRVLEPMPRVHRWLDKAVHRLHRAALEFGDTARILDHQWDPAGSALLAAASIDLGALMRETVSLTLRFRGAIDSVLLASASGLLPVPAAEPVRFHSPVRRDRNAVTTPVRQHDGRQPLGTAALSFRTVSPTRGPPALSLPVL
jgi:hypothetical protein